MKKLLLSIVSSRLLLGSSVIMAAGEEAGGAAEAPAMDAPAAAESAGGAADDLTAKNTEMFKTLDVNHDGVIDKKEAKADKALSKSFKKIAKKGKLDQAGYEKWAASQPKKS